ncbi:MAG: type II secretion system F family protein [Phycisphaeraceae bacterium]
MTHDPVQLAVLLLMTFSAAYLLVRYGYTVIGYHWNQQEQRYDRVLNRELLLEVPARLAMAAAIMVVVLLFLIGSVIGGWWGWGVLIGSVGLFLPWVTIRHLEHKRREKLELQLVDAIMTLASGVRAGLNLVQAMDLVVVNYTGPVKQEFAQLLREYQMGLDLNQAMRNTANRIGSSHYRLLFTAVEMHRLRGGDTAESLDRIAESVREIQRLEGKLDALTAQGRTQARMMAAAPCLILLLYYLIDPEGVTMLFIRPEGRLILLGALVLIVIGFLWIRKIMAVDI